MSDDDKVIRIGPASFRPRQPVECGPMMHAVLPRGVCAIHAIRLALLLAVSAEDGDRTPQKRTDLKNMASALKQYMDTLDAHPEYEELTMSLTAPEVSVLERARADASLVKKTKRLLDRLD